MQLFTNNATARLNVVLLIGGTTMQLQTGQGAKFASPTGAEFQLATLTDGTNLEIVRITSRTSDNLTIERAQEGTTAREWPANTTVEGRLTAASVSGLVRNNAVNPASSLAIGPNATADSTSCIAIGDTASVVGIGGVAIGSGSLAKSYGRAMFGAQAHDQGIALGDKARVYSRDTWTITGLSTLPRDDYNYGGEWLADMTGQATYCVSSWADLGNVPPWASSTSYTDGDVVRPTAGGAKQMHLWVDDYPTRTSVSSTVTEPTWDLTDYGATQNDPAGNDWWITTDPSAGYRLDLRSGVLFFVQEVGFICFKHSNVTAAPFMSAGTVSNNTLFVNNQQLSGITGAGQFQSFAVTVNTAVTSADGLLLKLETKATGTNSQFLGRWFVRGFAINTQGNV
jgi:hypothetical protein